MAAATHKQTTAQVYQVTTTIESAITIINLFPSNDTFIGFDAQGQIRGLQLWTGSQYIFVPLGHWVVVYTDGRPVRIVEDEKFRLDWELNPPETPGA